MNNPAGSVPASLSFLLLLIPFFGAVILFSIAWRAPFAESILITFGAAVALLFSLKLRKPATQRPARRDTE
jgi:hypothetical protein